MSIAAARFLLLCLCAAALALPVITTSADPGEAVFIEFNAGLLAVRLEKAALSEVLRTVGEQAEVLVTIHGNLGNVQPQVFSGVPLPEGITLLVQNSNADLVMIYNRDGAGHTYLEEIRAYEGNRNNRKSVNRTSVHAPPAIPTPAPPTLPVQPAGH